MLVPRTCLLLVLWLLVPRMRLRLVMRVWMPRVIVVMRLHV